MFRVGIFKKRNKTTEDTLDTVFNFDVIEFQQFMKFREHKNVLPTHGIIFNFQTF